MSARPEKLIINILLILLLAGCRDHEQEGNSSTAVDEGSAALPHYGEFDLEFRQLADGSMITDTVFYAIPKFSFTNQDNRNVTYKDYLGYVTIADFFFTECPSICPVMSSQLARIQSMAASKGWGDQIRFLSFSVKPENDTPEVLRSYGEKIGADFSNWNFLTGKSSDIYELAEEGFMLTAFPSDSAAGGIFHTDKVTILDEDLHIRGYYDGTSTKSMDQLFIDVQKLITDKNHASTRTKKK